MALAAIFMMPATGHADVAATRGGIKISSDDGRFQATIGGRIHFDGTVIDTDEEAAFGSAGTENDGFYLRRIFLTFKGRLYDWEYKVEGNFAPSESTGDSRNTFQEVYLGTGLGPGQITFGQRRPFRGMEELTSSNDLSLIERPFASAAGVFGGGNSREFQLGVFYNGNFLTRGTYGVSAHSLRRENTESTPGVGASARLSFAPRWHAENLVHFGASYSLENPDDLNNAAGSGNIGSRAVYAGRRGPNLLLGTTAENDSAQTLGLELAATAGAAHFQAEYMAQELGQGSLGEDQTVDVWYVQIGGYLTGERKPYKLDRGVFGSPAPKWSFGAWELVVRYDHGENADAANLPEAHSMTYGVNWYVNPNVRFMLNYVDAEAEQILGGVVEQDAPSSITARAQLNF